MTAQDPAAVLPDARPDNWVDRFAPRRLRPWLKLARLDRPAGAWLLLLPGWEGLALAGAAAHEQPDVTLYLRFAIGAVLMRSAGCAYNDIMDRDIDAKVARTAQRPLPSGQLSVRDAWSFLIACSLISFFVLATMNLTAILFGVLSLGLVAAYPFMKRITWWPQAWLGLTFNWGVLLGAAAASAGASGLMILTGRFLVATHAWLTFSFNPGRPPGLAAVLLYGSGVLWTLGYDTIYAVQDLEDDALVGVRSSARRLGPRVGRGVAVFYGLCLVLALAAGVLARLSVFYYPFWAAFSAHLLWQARRLRPNDPQGALALFRSNRTAGLILTLGLAAGGVPLRL